MVVHEPEFEKEVFFSTESGIQAIANTKPGFAPTKERINRISPFWALKKAVINLVFGIRGIRIEFTLQCEQFESPLDC